ncbi:MAG: polymerase subunit delta [Petroclostridium sp.]|uniref:DNA polymerase III subunit delta n=1 Tax=Petroclostridium xylanilyticum TaxID=1792311 RepID=UPI0012FF71BA|nr:DNA polymerase III subunit delta [Petroclostridium xylanilyticum]MBZ4644691.1 polymerase delta subunit [Clostridia bacterium]MDK2811256.1 polymerase subunit delta [Petroclostridium sp.]
MSVDILKKQLKDGVFSNIYLFFGEEDFLKEYYYNQLKSKIVDKSFEDFNFCFYEGKNIDLQQVQDGIESLPVMSEYKMVVIKDSGIFKSPKAQEKEFWETYLKDMPSYICLVFYEKEIDQRSKLFNLVKKQGLILDFKYQKTVDLVNWVNRVITSYKKKIEKEDIYYLLEHCDVGMTSIKNEIDKLVHYCGNRETIRRQDIEAVCTKSVESKVFNMIDAIMDNNTQLAFELLNDMITLKEPAVKIISLLSKHFYDILKVKLLLKEGATAESIANRVHIPHFAVKKYIKHAQNFSVQYLHSMIQECLKADSDIKSSKMNEWVALHMFMVKCGSNRKMV